MNEFLQAISIKDSNGDALAPPSGKIVEGQVYAVQNYLDGSRLDSIPPHFCYTMGWAGIVWNGLQPLDSTIAVAVAPTRSLRVWPRLAWEQLKDALQEYSSDNDLEMPVGANSVLQLACDYLEVTAGGIFPASFATIVSTGKFFDWIQPLAKRFQSLVSFARRGFILYGRKPFLISVFQKVSSEAAAHEHTLHIESIALARAHSRIALVQTEEPKSDLGRVIACLTFVFICFGRFFRCVSPKLPVRSGAKLAVIV